MLGIANPFVIQQNFKELWLLRNSTLVQQSYLTQQVWVAQILCIPEKGLPSGLALGQLLRDELRTLGPEGTTLIR